MRCRNKYPAQLSESDQCGNGSEIFGSGPVGTANLEIYVTEIEPRVRCVSASVKKQFQLFVDTRVHVVFCVFMDQLVKSEDGHPVLPR